ncbi:MAG: DUF4405 domain-containing protein [Candidatus Aenigmarchaeota archaeon]|nr:DUF4405 domain-containing protein [Candidatus Aenigmarchaeota archaeon]
MKTLKINYVIDLLMVVFFAIIAITGVIKYFFLEPFAGRYQQYYFLGISKYTWSVWHDYAGLILLALIAVHVVLHLKWIWNMTKSFLRKKEGFKTSPEL